MSPSSRWCPQCGAELERTAVRSVWQCDQCGLNTDAPLIPPVVEWWGDGGNWVGRVPGWKLRVFRGATLWSWTLWRTDHHGLVVDEDPIARGRAASYPQARRHAVGALTFALSRSGLLDRP